MCLTACLSFFIGSAFSQFAGPAGTPGTTAMFKDSSAFVAWATSCNVQRGYQIIANPFQGLVSHGAPSDALGPADGAMVVSLGDSGIATLSFDYHIIDGPGPDFAVFENSFSTSFLELAFVEVSSDGTNFFRFPATSNTQTSTQIGPFDNVGDATLLDNLAGKYHANYGTPFDLGDLSGTPGLDLQQITHVRIVDAIGTIDHAHAVFDQNGNAINDPYPTAFASGGFDLDAVGVINRDLISSINELTQHRTTAYPNPIQSGGHLHVSHTYGPVHISLLSMDGKQMLESEDDSIEIDLPAGTYLMKITLGNQTSVERLIVR